MKNKNFIVILFIILIFFVVFLKTQSVQAQTTPVLTYTNKTFYLNGVATSRFGLRAANALESDAITNRLIGDLDSMKAHGIQAVSISLQGGNTGTTNIFNSNGSLIASYTSRLSQILNALAVRNMVGAVTYFYQARDETLTNDDAVRTAVQNITNYLKPWRNVWLYTINEVGHKGFDRNILKTEAGQIEIHNLIKSLDPARVTYVSNTANDGFLAGTGKTKSQGNVVTEYSRQDKYFHEGGIPGVFTSEQITQAQADATTTFNNQAYWYWHAAWHQQVQSPDHPKFNKGGGGTASSPGVAFIWNKMQSLSGNPLPSTSPQVSPSILPSPTFQPSPSIIPTISPSINPSPSPNPADADGDGDADSDDFKILINNYAKILSGKVNGDFSINGKVNLLDYGLWLKYKSN